MIIDHSGGLHVGIYHCAANKLKTALLQILADPIRERGSGRGQAVIGYFILNGFSSRKPPVICTKSTEFFLNFQKGPGIRDT